MIKKVPFNLFGEEQYIYFNIPRLLEFEKAIGRSLSVNDFLSNPFLSLKETLTGLTIAMKHYNRKATADYYAEKISTYMEETGNGINDISDLLVRAIVESGIYGKRVTDMVTGKSVDENEEDEKNE